MRHTEERASWTGQFRALLSEEEAPRFEVANKRGTILTVHATSASWANRLRFRVPELLPALQRLQDFSNIEQIRIRTAHRPT